MKDKKLNSTEKMVEAYRIAGICAAAFCRGFGKEEYKVVNPTQSEWKKLDVECLPEDILIWTKHTHEVQRINYEMHDEEWYNDDLIFKGDFSIIKAHGIEYRYRPTQTKKSHEELSEEYAKDIDRGSSRVFTLGELVSLREGFIAGRKSMEREK